MFYLNNSQVHHNMYEMLYPGVAISAMTMCHFAISLENVHS